MKELPETSAETARTEKEYLYWLCQVPALGAVGIQALWESFGSFREIFCRSPEELSRRKIISRAAAAGISGWKERIADTTGQLNGLSGKGIRFVSFLDEEYPARLKHIYGRPAGLYVKGKLPKEEAPSVAIIGARGCSSYGRQVARMLGSSLGREGIQIISGLALGVDGEGHAGALSARADTFAVLGCGVDVCYPREHIDMYEQIRKNGGIISEFPLGAAPHPGHFPMRNRIISGLSDAVVVVEAREKSGSLITAELALEQGKEVMAVPGMITDALSRGCNNLIRQGAAAVTSPEDILEYFQIKRDKMIKLREKNEKTLAKNEKMVYSCLDLQPKFIDQVVEACGLPLGECMTILLELELRGYILQPTDHYYVKRI